MPLDASSINPLERCHVLALRAADDTLDHEARLSAAMDCARIMADHGAAIVSVARGDFVPLARAADALANAILEGRLSHPEAIAALGDNAVMLVGGQYRLRAHGVEGSGLSIEQAIERWLTEAFRVLRGAMS